MSRRTPILAEKAPARTKPSHYPEPFFSRMQRRVKHPLGDLFGLTRFGVNLTTLQPGGVSALLHRHSHQDEFVYIVQGEATLLTEEGCYPMGPGSCIGFPAKGLAHCIANRTETDVTLLEIGDRHAEDSVFYPEDDLAAALGPDGAWVFTTKDGTPYR